MENHDKIFEKIKNASLSNEASNFASMEKVWSRVEGKLDNKVLKKQNQLWKKIAIAASFLLVFTISYQVFQPAKQIVTPPAEIFPSESVKTIPPAMTEQSAIISKSPKPNTIIKKNTTTISNEQIKSVTETVTEDKTREPESEQIFVEPVPAAVSEMKQETAKEKDAVEESRQQNSFKKAKAFDARGIQRNAEVAADQESDKVIPQPAAQKSDPLVVVNGKAKLRKGNKIQTVNDDLSGLDPRDIDKIEILKEPLYIINGSYYSEQELFGPNPTSPYHPLNQQEIETLSVLQGEKAIAAYGKKGEKGVVIITTKNGRPVKMRTQKEP